MIASGSDGKKSSNVILFGDEKNKKKRNQKMNEKDELKSVVSRKRRQICWRNAIW